MIKTLKKLFRQDKVKFNIVDIDYQDLTDETDLIRQLFSNEIDGVFVRGVLSKVDIEKVKSRLNSIDEATIDKIGAHISEGFLIPKAFPVVVMEQRDSKESTGLADYFRGCEKLVTDSLSVFDIDLFGKVDEALNRLAKFPVNIVQGKNGIGNYPFGTVRAFVPGPGNISVHCGNYFQKEFPEFYEELEASVEVKNQLSYTIKLQNEDAGGELTLYDLYWSNTQTKKDVAENKIVMEGSRKIDIDNKDLQRVSINYKEGDMFVFAGGRIWHRVEHVKGKTTRMTVGGFIGKSKSSDGYKYWA